MTLTDPVPDSALCRSHSAAVSEVGAVEREIVTTTNLIFMGTQRVHTSLVSSRSGATLTDTRRPVNSGLPLIANADQRPLMRPRRPGITDNPRPNGQAVRRRRACADLRASAAK